MIERYGRIRVFGIFGMVAVALVLGAVALVDKKNVEAQIAAPQTIAQLAKFPYQYSVKFVCGLQKPEIWNTVATDDHLQKETPVKPGNYATAVNVHNPARFPTAGQIGTANMLKKAVLALPEPDQGAPSPFHNQELRPDGATEIDCPEIRKILGEQGGAPEQFIKGFFVIYSSRELDVVGVYTAQSLDANSVPTGMTMDVEYIPVRRF